MNRCGICEAKTDRLTEHYSEVDPPTVFHPECCPGGCDSAGEVHG